jgi:hypothetical protein
MITETVRKAGGYEQRMTSLILTFLSEYFVRCTVSVKFKFLPFLLKTSCLCSIITGAYLIDVNTNS